jgi:Zn-dependent M28 family amino/carboxypeptidase
VPLDQTIAYVNFDIQGSNLLPSLANYTIMVGAETGGPDLVAAADEATNASSLDTVALSLLFGQRRSDHAVLAEAGVPSVFFTDANSGCYHTVKDDIDAVDFAKLDQQINAAEALSRDLVATDTPPVFDAAAPPSTYDDAAELLTIVEAAQPDLDLVDAEQRASAEQFLVDLQAVVDAGPEAFDDAANAVLLGGAVEVVSALAEVDCDAFLP